MQEDRETIDHDGVSASPETLGTRLWESLAALICNHSTVEEPEPCLACMRQVKPQVKPIARALVIAGRRVNNNYILTGRAVLYLIAVASGQIPDVTEREAGERLGVA